jgi:hypothetical protein
MLLATFILRVSAKNLEALLSINIIMSEFADGDVLARSVYRRKASFSLNKMLKQILRHYFNTRLGVAFWVMFLVFTVFFSWKNGTMTCNNSPQMRYPPNYSG